MHQRKFDGVYEYIELLYDSSDSVDGDLLETIKQLIDSRLLGVNNFSKDDVRILISVVAHAYLHVDGAEQEY